MRAPIVILAAAIPALVGCGAPCTAYCQKLISCAPTGILSCEDQPTCEERCGEAQSEDQTGDFAAGAACVANPNFSCQDLLKGACPDPQAQPALPAVESCAGGQFGKQSGFSTYPGPPWALCTAQAGSIGGAGCAPIFSGG
ncbi:MAG: hypothetical protein ACYCWW_15300 [Deltaproteobacteria bacterium]